MSNQKIKAEERKLAGRKVKQLRRNGQVPANIFGRDVKSQSVQVSSDEFSKVFQEAGETGVVEITIGSKTVPALINEVQTHPTTGEILHVNFRQVDLTKKVTATVPVELVGESPAEKSGIGTVVQQLNELDVTALPGDFPENFEVDISTLTEVDQAIAIKDLKFDAKKLEIEQDKEQIVANVAPVQEEKVEAPVQAEEAEGEEAKDGAGDSKEPESQKESSDN